LSKRLSDWLSFVRAHLMPTPTPMMTPKSPAPQTAAKTFAAALFDCRSGGSEDDCGFGIEGRDCGSGYDSGGMLGDGELVGGDHGGDSGGAEGGREGDCASMHQARPSLILGTWAHEPALSSIEHEPGWLVVSSKYSKVSQLISVQVQPQPVIVQGADGGREGGVLGGGGNTGGDDGGAGRRT